MKKLVSLVLAGVMFVICSKECIAAEFHTELETIESEDMIEKCIVVDEQILSDGVSRASWGKGILYAENPLFSKPSAYAETCTFAGNAYYLSAYVQLIDEEDISYFTGVAEIYNSDTVTSATIVSPTEVCYFCGVHKIQDTATSGTQSCTTGKGFY